MKKFLLLLTGVVLASGCAATITPRGEVYTELLAPTSTVIVEEQVVQPVVVSSPRPVVVSAPRPFRTIHPRPYHYAKNPGPRSSGKGGGHGSSRNTHDSHGTHGPRGR